MMRLAIVGIVVAVLLWDGYLWATKKPTITQVMIRWSKKNPFIPFAWGFLMGHFYG